MKIADYATPTRLEAVIDGAVVPFDPSVAARVAQQALLQAVTPEHYARLSS